jgi:transcriptional regulator with XRE-family HTH domain
MLIYYTPFFYYTKFCISPSTAVAWRHQSVGGRARMKQRRSAMDFDKGRAATDLGARVAWIRKTKAMTLHDVADKCGVAASTISKIENAAISPTYGNLLRIAHGLGVDIAALVSDSTSNGANARRSICRQGQGVVYSIGTHSWELLCTDLAKKKMQPMLGRVHANSVNDIGRLTSHPGEEVLYVVSGEVILLTEHYEPIRLKVGDCAYLDSTMGHLCLRGSKREAVIFWVCSEFGGTEALGDRQR